MKVETVEQTEDEVIELAKNQEMKSLMDGSEPPVISDPEPKVEENPEDNLLEETPQEPEVTEPTEKEQLQAALDRIQKLERALDKTNGTYGNELNRLKNKLAEVESKKRDIAANITPAQFKRIREQYGDDLADALIGDLTETFSVSQEQPAQQSKEPEVDPRLDAMAQSTEQLAGQVRQMAITELTRIHPDWRNVAAWEAEEIDGVGSVIRWSDPAFGVWLNKQDTHTRNVVFASDDINAVAEVLTKYKSENKPADQTKPQTSTKEVIQKKLEKAVLPTGRRTGSHELLTEEEIIEKARQEEQKRIMTGIY